MASSHTAILPDPQPQPVVGGPFKFQSGIFAGRILRSALDELQKANLGRKYACKDKRPLDPPPVVRLRCFQTINAGTKRETEKELDNFDEHSIFGFICHVDLIPLHHGRKYCQPATSDSTASQRPPAQMIVIPAQLVGTSASAAPARETSAQPSQAQTAAGADPYGAPCTSLLYGETFVPCKVLDHEGRQTALFVFSDLAVRREGQFILRYRVFNISGEARCVPVLAECYGGPFEIFSTKSFPGLKASTDLTKSLSLSGIRVNARYRERKVGKKARYYTPDSLPSAEDGSASTVSMALSGPVPGVPQSQSEVQRDSVESQTASMSSAQPSGFIGVGGVSGSPPMRTPPAQSLSGLFSAGSDPEAAQAALDAWQARERRETPGRGRGRIRRRSGLRGSHGSGGSVGSDTDGTDVSGGVRARV